MELRNKVVMVTGGAGFIGSYVSRRLINEGCKVIVLDNLFRGSLDNLSEVLDNNCFQFHRIDLEHNDSISNVANLIIRENVELILHYAAINGTQYFYDIPEKVCVTNSLATLYLMKAIEMSKLKPEIVFASTSETYGEPNLVPTPEHGKTYFRIEQDRDSYSVAKMMSEFYIKLFAQKLGCKFLILRIFNVYGKGMIGSKYGQVIPEFIQRLQQGEYPLRMYGNGVHTRSFCHIDDHIELTIRLLTSDYRNDIINLGNDEEISIKELAVRIMRLLKLEPKIVYLDERKGDHLRRCPDITRLKSIVGEFQFIPLNEGLLKSM